MKQSQATFQLVKHHLSMIAPLIIVPCSNLVVDEQLSALRNLRVSIVLEEMARPS